MDSLSGKNSTGRRVSLLNDGPAPPQLVRLPSITPSLQSRTSRYSTSPIASPPRLSRSDSSDSATMNTPSPLTPDFDFGGAGLPSAMSMDSPTFSSHNGFFPQQKEPASAYPPVPQSSVSLPYQHASTMQPQMYQPTSQRPLEDAAAQQQAQRPKKNSYPCPMAKQYNCNDYFTTSGHAARHAKKHTGKKDAYCPECNKAFTRKDNMEQHRRTHQTGRGAAKAGERDVKKAKQAKRPRPSPLQSSMIELSPLASSLDPALPISPAGSFQLTPAVQPSDPFAEFAHAQRSPYGDPAAYAINAYNSGSSYGGLDALAIAASGEKRKFES